MLGLHGSEGETELVYLLSELHLTQVPPMSTCVLQERLGTSLSLASRSLQDDKMSHLSMVHPALYRWYLSFHDQFQYNDYIVMPIDVEEDGKEPISHLCAEGARRTNLMDSVNLFTSLLMIIMK